MVSSSLLVVVVGHCCWLLFVVVVVVVGSGVQQVWWMIKQWTMLLLLIMIVRRSHEWIWKLFCADHTFILLDHSSILTLHRLRHAIFSLRDGLHHSKEDLDAISSSGFLRYHEGRASPCVKHNLCNPSARSAWIIFAYTNQAISLAKSSHLRSKIKQFT